MPMLTTSCQLPLKPFGTQTARLWPRSNQFRVTQYPYNLSKRFFASQSPQSADSSNSEASQHASDAASSKPTIASKPSPLSTPPADWEDNPNYNIEKFSELPHTNFGVNQHIVINDEFKEALRQILWQFRAPIRYAFAYGSGVFPQSKVWVTYLKGIHSRCGPRVASGNIWQFISFSERRTV